MSRGALVLSRLTTVAVAAGFAACSRHADLLDEPDGFVVVLPPVPDAGDIPALDGGLGSDAFPVCADRDPAACRGSVDFPCNFDRWVQNTAVKCQQLTGCKTNGWLRVKLGVDGCVEEIGMDHPNDAIVACLLADLGAAHCPCSARELKYFFGVANAFDASGAGPDGSFCTGPKG